MDISLNEEQTRLFETARDFARGALTPEHVRKLEESDHGFAPAVWKAMAELGWLGAVFPEQYGGSDAGFLELGLIVEALAQSAIPSPLFSTVIEAGLLLLEAGNPAQRQQWLPKIVSGQAILTTAVVEPHGSLEPNGVHVTMARSGGRILVNGTKTLVRDAGAADSIICLGRSGPAATDVSLVMIPKQTPGVSMRRLVAAGGEALWEVTFEQVKADDGNLIGSWNAAWPHVARLLQRGAAFKSAELTGIGQAALELTLAYARTRIQFDKPIGSFQAVQHHCANMYRDVEVCRLLTWQAVASASGVNATREISMAKAKCSAAIPAVTRTAHQVHGAIAFYRDYPLELYYNRAIAAKAAYGDARHHRRVLARMLPDNLDQFRREERHALPIYSL